MKLRNIISILLICLFMANTVKSQNVVSKIVTSTVKSSVNRTIGKQGVKLSAEKIAQLGIKRGAEHSVEKAMSKRLVSRIIRKKVSRMIAEKGFKNLYTYGNRRAAKTLTKIGRPAIIGSSKASRFAEYINRIGKNSAKAATKKEAEKK